MIWARVLKNNYLKITELYQTPTKNLVYLLVSRFYDLGLNWLNKLAHTYNSVKFVSEQKNCFEIIF